MPLYVLSQSGNGSLVERGRMTLGQLRAELKQYGIRQVGTLRKTKEGEQPGPIAVYFSSDKVVFPFRPKNLYPLVLNSDSDDTRVNSEKVKALKRALLPPKMR